MDMIKLIWDFRGPDSAMTASQHERHLRDYASSASLSPGITGLQEISDEYSLAYLVIQREDMVQVRDALKPHRAEVYPIDPSPKII